MKKRLVSIFSTVLLALTLVALLCGCSTYGSVKSAFEKKDYKEAESVETYQTQIKEYLGESSENCSVHLFTKGLTDGIAIICEFNTTDEIDQTVKDNKALQDVIKDIQKSDYVNGTCILLPIPVLTIGTPVVEIFKNA